MADSLDFIQIIYKEEQRLSCYPFAQIYFNETLTDYFENDVIARLVPTLNADYISICSWRLKQKRNDASTPMVLNHDLELSKEKILKNDFDVAILTPRRPGFRPLEMAANWHGKVWTDAFTVFANEFLRPMGIRLPDVSKEEDLKHTIHENHFIARKEIYQEYVRYALQPAINFMFDRPSLFGNDSGYILKKRDREEIKDYQKKSGRQDWPIAPFILERLFSIWINDKNFNVINL
jgi:hypothetical protein